MKEKISHILFLESNTITNEKQNLPSTTPKRRMFRLIMSVKSWLDSLGLSQYMSQFLAEGYDLKVISVLSEELTKMGVKVGHRKKILLYFQENAVVTTSPSRAHPHQHL